MNLDQAIKKIINDHGADVLKERRLVSMLSDLQAFGQLPYAANMLRQIYANGYGTKIHQLYCSQDQTEVAAFLSELRNKLGFDMDMLGKVLYAFSLPVQKVGKQNLRGYKHKQIKRTIEACQLKVDAEAVAGVHIEYKLSKQIKNESNHSWEYTIDDEVFSEYILECNEDPYLYLKTLKLESPEAVMIYKSCADTMPDIINHDKYRQVFLTLLDELNSLNFYRYIILVKIKRELLDDSKPFSKDYLRYKDFYEFLEINNWLRTKKDKRVSNMDNSTREIAMYFIDALENTNVKYYIPKVLSILENISKNHRIDSAQFVFD